MDTAQMPLGRQSFSIVPVVQGAGDEGWLIAVGVLFIIAGFFIPGMQVVGFGFIGGAGPIAGLSAWGLVAASVGVAMIAAGTASLISSVGDMDDFGLDDSEENKASQFFGGAVNTAAQGNPVPVLMGELHCGSATISIGVSSVDDVADEEEEGS